MLPAVEPPDVEQLLARALHGTGGARALTVTPDKLAEALPVIQVARIGGADDRVTDTARVDLDSMAATRPAARDLAAAVHSRIVALRHTLVGSWLIDDVEVVTAPIWVDYQDENIQRYVGTYDVALRMSAYLALTD